MTAYFGTRKERNMRHSAGYGGMQTCGANYTIICPKCGKPAARREGDAYMHFTKKGVIWHIWDGEKWIARRNRGGSVWDDERSGV
jgi:hypothetical protein